METVNLNLAHRRYLGYDLDQPMPDHSSLSNIRDRCGLGVFQSFSEKVGNCGLKLSRTIADQTGSKTITSLHLVEVLQYRRKLDLMES